ncbi:MAG: acyl carrier protein [Myxococcota bacterium]|nr:acyl carrier protein [Myxococcota bacterium]
MKGEALDAAAPLSSLGFDSLMAVQLKNQIEADLGVVVPVIQFLDGPSLNQIVESVLKVAGSAPARGPVESSGGDAWEEGSL